MMEWRERNFYFMIYALHFAGLCFFFVDVMCVMKTIHLFKFFNFTFTIKTKFNSNVKRLPPAALLEMIFQSNRMDYNSVCDTSKQAGYRHFNYDFLLFNMYTKLKPPTSG